MTPDELRDAVDPDWPVETRFLIERAAEAWEEDVKHEEIRQKDLISCVRKLAKEMSGGLWHRIRAKKYQSLIDESESACRRVEQGYRHLSEERESHEQEERHPEDAQAGGKTVTHGS